MNALSLNRPVASRPLATTSLQGEATRSNSAAPRAAERSGAQRELPRMDASMLTRLGSSFAPSAPRAIPGVAAAGETEKTVRAAPRRTWPSRTTPRSSPPCASTTRWRSRAARSTWTSPTRYRGDLVVTLTSPSGKSVKLHDRAGGSLDDLKAKFDLAAFAGESMKGDWKLTVEDTAKQDIGTLKAWDLELTGTTKGEEPASDGSRIRSRACVTRRCWPPSRSASTGKDVVSYNEARKHIFSDLDVKNGKVKCVYTGREINGGKIPNSSDMNIEHTWPQSKGATGDAKSDLHHLFPTDSKANSTRSSYPFGKVEKVQWSQGGSKFGTDAQGRKVFEPRRRAQGQRGARDVLLLGRVQQAHPPRGGARAARVEQAGRGGQRRAGAQREASPTSRATVTSSWTTRTWRPHLGLLSPAAQR